MAAPARLNTEGAQQAVDSHDRRAAVAVALLYIADCLLEKPRQRPLTTDPKHVKLSVKLCAGPRKARLMAGHVFSSRSRHLCEDLPDMLSHLTGVIVILGRS